MEVGGLWECERAEVPTLAMGLPGLAPAPPVPPPSLTTGSPGSPVSSKADLRNSRWLSCWHLAGQSLWSRQAQGGRTEVDLGWGPRTLREGTIGGKNSPLFTIGHTSS